MGILQILTVAANTVSGKPEPAIGVVVATGLILVFSLLVLLYLLIVLEGIIFTSIDNKKKGISSNKEPAPCAPKISAPPVHKAAVIEPGIPGEVVAAIAAAIASMEGGQGYVLRSLKRAKTGRSAWGQAGVASYTEPF